jgi:hypothetical protein
MKAQVATTVSPESGMLLKTTRRGMARLGSGSHAGSHTDEQPSDDPDPPGQREEASPRSRTGLNGSGCPHMELRIRRLYTVSRLIVGCFSDVPVIPSAHQRCRGFAVPWL